MSSTKFQCQNAGCDICNPSLASASGDGGGHGCGGSHKHSHGYSPSLDFAAINKANDAKLKSAATQKRSDEHDDSHSHNKHSTPAIPRTQKCQYCGVLCVSLNGHGLWCMKFPNSCPNFCKDYKVVNLPRAEVIPHLKSKCSVTENLACPYVQFGCSYRAPNKHDLLLHSERSKAAHALHIELLTKAFMDVTWADNAGAEGAAYVIHWYTALIKQKIDDSGYTGTAPPLGLTAAASTATATASASAGASKKASVLLSVPGTNLITPASPLASDAKRTIQPAASAAAKTGAGSAVPTAPAAPAAPTAPGLPRAQSSSDKLKQVQREQEFLNARELMLSTIKKRGASSAAKEADPIAVAAGSGSGGQSSAAAANGAKVLPPPPKPQPKPLPGLAEPVTAASKPAPAKISDLKEHAARLASVFPTAAPAKTLPTAPAGSGSGSGSGVVLGRSMPAPSAAASRADLQSWKEQVTAVLEKKLEAAPNASSAGGAGGAAASEGAGIQKLQRMMCYGRTFKRYHLHSHPTDESLFYRKTSATGTLHWCDGAGRNVTEQNSLPLSAITDIFLGKQANAFKVGFAELAVEECCFSLVGLLPNSSALGAGGGGGSGGGDGDGSSFVERRLDVEATTSRRRDAWLCGILAILRANNKEVKLHQSTTFGGIPANHWYAWKESRVRSLQVYMGTHRASEKVKNTEDFKLDALAAMGFVDRV